MKTQVKESLSVLPSKTRWLRRSRREERCAAEPRNEFLNNEGPYQPLMRSRSVIPSDIGQRFPLSHITK